MFFNILLPFLELLMGLTGCVGLIMVGSRALHRKRPTAITIKLVVAALVFFVLIRWLLPKPDQQDLVGRYHLYKVTVPDFDQSEIKDYSLTFLPKGKFAMTSLPHIDLGETGTYLVDHSSSLNEIKFSYDDQFGGGGLTAHIDRRLGSYRIVFFVGDPDIDESYYFEKDSKR